MPRLLLWIAVLAPLAWAVRPRTLLLLLSLLVLAGWAVRGTMLGGEFFG